jgi:hypothetical protein
MSRRARPREPCARSPQTRRPAQPSSAHSRSPTLNPRNGRSRIARKKQSRPVSHQCRLPESSPTPRATDIESPVCPSMRPVARIRSSPARARPLSALKRCCGARIGRRTLPLPPRLATAMRSPVPGGAACAVDRLPTARRASCEGAPRYAPVKRRSLSPRKGDSDDVRGPAHSTDTPISAATSLTRAPASTAITARYRCSTTDNATNANPGLPPPTTRTGAADHGRRQARPETPPSSSSRDSTWLRDDVKSRRMLDGFASGDA